VSARPPERPLGSPAAIRAALEVPLLSSIVRSARRGLVVAVASLALLSAAAAPASASPETIKRSLTNILFGPLDFVLSPIVGTRSVYNNLRDIDDTMGVRIFYTIPGIAWNIAFNAGGGVVRMITGLLEFVPGLILIPFEADMDPIFAPPQRADALIDEEYDLLTVKIGINYVD
jgi:hypothetical protein